MKHLLLLAVCAAFALSCATAPKRAVIHGDSVRRVAIHEAGHVIAWLLLEKSVPIYEIRVRTKRARGESMGHVRPGNVSALETLDEIVNGVVVSLAGREAERAVFGEATNGGTRDLMNANSQLRKMCCVSGMCGDLLVPEEGECVAEHRNTIGSCLDRAKLRARAIVGANLDAVKLLANILLSIPKDKEGSHILRGAEMWKVLHALELSPEPEQDQLPECPPYYMLDE